VVVMLFLRSSLYQCHAWSLIFLNLLQVLMVIMFFMFKLTSMSCSKSYVFEFVTSVNSHLLFLCSSLHQCYAWSLVSLNLLQVLMVVMCLNSLQCHFNNASICHAWCYYIV
jgi:hypothetical protein